MMVEGAVNRKLPHSGLEPVPSHLVIGTMCWVPDHHPPTRFHGNREYSLQGIQYVEILQWPYRDIRPTDSPDVVWLATAGYIGLHLPLGICYCALKYYTKHWRFTREWGSDREVDHENHRQLLPMFYAIFFHTNWCIIYVRNNQQSKNSGRHSHKGVTNS